ncbi:hypothetical protein QBC40DRAFT_280837 [Triangularia verruculosa]|uniref:Uncharacterized protein n=1 Tax=Triangularia verruculosa TaxID=2587418 RepID=A0AAN7AWF8_9PEZI|nr:hypothetical protein QBC40DRAFT_280837 [Triangularia verruculosa]
MGGATTILRGFKISVATLDRFLEANGNHRTYSTPPFANEHPDGAVSQLLFKKVSAYNSSADKNGFRLLIPTQEAMERSKTAYISYVWTVVRAHRELNVDEDLPAEVPKGFRELRDEIMGFGKDLSEGEEISGDGKMGLYLVVNDDSLYSGIYAFERH